MRIAPDGGECIDTELVRAGCAGELDLFEYVINAIKYAVAKDKENAQKPVWDLHVVTIIVAALFLVYFFVPVA